jgi:hypothetical protein
MWWGFHDEGCEIAARCMIRNSMAHVYQEWMVESRRWCAVVALVVDVLLPNLCSSLLLLLVDFPFLQVVPFVSMPCCGRSPIPG